MVRLASVPSGTLIAALAIVTGALCRALRGGTGLSGKSSADLLPRPHYKQVPPAVPDAQDVQKLPPPLER
jgi:hypothetical protein